REEGGGRGNFVIYLQCCSKPSGVVSVRFAIFNCVMDVQVPRQEVAQEISRSHNFGEMQLPRMRTRSLYLLPRTYKVIGRVSLIKEIENDCTMFCAPFLH